MESSLNKPYININGNLKKRVLFVITQSDMGGAQRFMLHLLSHLDKEKFEPLVAIGKDGDGYLFHALHDIGIPTHRLTHLVRDVSIRQDLKAVSELRKLILDFWPDTLFLNSSKAGFVGSFAARFPYDINNAKVLYRIGGWSFNDPVSRWKRGLWIFLEWLSARWKDVVIVNNQHDFDQALKYRFKPRKKLTLVYNGIETYKLDLMDREEARTKLKIPGDKYVIGTIANLYPAKGIKYFIRTAFHFRDDENLVFFVIGDGRERPELEAMIKDLGLEKKVFLVGQMPDASRYLSAFDIFILSSLKEGFPFAVIEAMAAKLPIVATRVGAIPEIIEDGKNGLIVEPGDPKALADKIKEIIDSSHLQKELGIQAHQTVLFKFELDKMMSQIEDLL